MTIIFTKASKQYILQVSDRLVTKSHMKFDELANKSIIFCALNGILVISYTGHAFIGAIPTDQWISKILIGKSFIGDEKPPAFGFGKTKYVHIGPALNIIKESLNKAVINDIKDELKNNWIDRPFYLSIAGWLWGSKGKARPTMGWLGKPSGSSNFKLSFKPRYWFSGNRFTIGAIPSSNCRKGTLQSLLNQLPDKGIDEAEEILSDKIMEVSTYNSVVGPDCMSISIPPPYLAHIHPLRVRYISKRKAVAELLTETKKDIIEVAFTPWLIGPGGFSSPSIVSGSGGMSLCLYNVTFDAPQDHKIGGLISSLKRPKI
jgi:hypothetical protein